MPIKVDEALLHVSTDFMEPCLLEILSDLTADALEAVLGLLQDE
jgi:hypothetical protein